MYSGSPSYSGTEGHSAKAMLLGWLALGLVPALLLLAAGVAYTRGWRTWTRLDKLVMWGLAGVLLFSVGGLMWTKGRRFFRQRWMHLVLLNVMGWGGCLLAEGILSLLRWGPKLPEYHARPPGIKKVFKPRPGLMPGIPEGEAHVTTNRRGIRGPELPQREAAYRILCLGGSTTECLYLDDTKAWSSVLMEMLNAQPGLPRVWVGSIGISAYATKEHLRFVEHSRLAREMDCLVFLIGINDFVKYLGGIADQIEGTEPFWSRSRVMNVARLLWFGQSPTGNIVVEDAAAEIYPVRRRLRRQGERCDRLPELDGALREYQERVRAMVRRCRELEVRAVFVSQPVLWEGDLSPEADELLWMGWNERRQYLPADQLRVGMDRYNTALEAVCREMGAEFVDLKPMHGRLKLFCDDCHFNVAGAEEVARRLYTWFVEHPPTRRPAKKPREGRSPGPV